MTEFCRTKGETPRQMTRLSDAPSCPGVGAGAGRPYSIVFENETQKGKVRVRV